MAFNFNTDVNIGGELKKSDRKVFGDIISYGNTLPSSGQIGDIFLMTDGPEADEPDPLSIKITKAEYDANKAYYDELNSFIIIEDDDYFTSADKVSYGSGNVKDALTWKYIGVTTGGTLNIPSTAREVYFHVKWATNSVNVVDGIINMEIASIQTNSYLHYGSGGAWSANNGGLWAVLLLSGRTLKIYKLNMENRGDVASTSELHAWYR